MASSECVRWQEARPARVLTTRHDGVRVERVGRFRERRATAPVPFPGVRSGQVAGRVAA